MMILLLLAKQIDMSEGFFFDEEENEYTYWISKKDGFDVEFLN